MIVVLALLVPALLLTGCMQNPDIRQGRDRYPEITLIQEREFFNCIKFDIGKGFETVVIRSGEESSIYADSPDNAVPSGPVEFYILQDDNRYAVYQRTDLRDQGRLIDRMVACSKGLSASLQKGVTENIY
ncbi:hypothetical protein SAMN05216535_3154 [Stutzerimonas xanthomarina]|uniref:Lipoprotein n=2 Tax=Stutzerimonas xanthomarina TaxID=271420 RepID=A0A1M5S644_9GAMM|nr:hypothetical protein SAMN05216535_3154 [Stutzerimonas xanthomarina]SHH33910.1 hypothetical protein SAMN02744645_3302 [Stutzerimonas xanthomarina DSM 18231]